MPLPTPGSVWPPPAFAPAIERMDCWEAWWSGDPDLLGAHYGAGSPAGHQFFRPSQYAGGVVGAMSRMWWGRPAAANEPSAKLHVPLAGDICRASSDLLFSEPIGATSADEATSARLDDLLDEGMQAKLLEAAEVCAALGGVYLRPVYDQTISDRAWLDAVSPEGALPEWRWGRLAAVTFWRVVQRQDGQVWRHFEHHMPAWTQHALYQGEDGKVGRPVPLQDVEATASLAAMVNEDGAAPTGYDRLAVTYVPHMLPNRRWRKRPMLAPMGRSAIDGCEPLLDALDEVYSSWMRDIRLAKGRVLVADSMLDDHGPGRGASWDPDREVYGVVPGSMMTKDSALTVVQFAIRVAEHKATADELVEAALRHAGYSGRSLGMQDDGAPVTATEITAGERRSFVTRDRQIGYWRPALAASALPALLAVDGFAFGRKVDLSEPVNVEFADSVSEDIATIANTVNVLGQAQAASTDTKVRMLHPDWSDEQVAAEVEAIRADAGPALVSPFDYDGGPTETGDVRQEGGA